MAAAAAVIGCSDPVCAGDPGGTTPSKPARFETWAGAQVFSDAWSLYTGVSVAPFAGLDQDGLRVRAVGGYGAYSYSGGRPVGLVSQTIKFNGAAAFGDLLVGYHKQLGPVTIKGFAGLMVTQNEVAPYDPETAIQGSGVGGKVLLESWWNVTDRFWTSLDGSWGTVHDSYATRGRVGWRALAPLSVGFEAGAAGNLESDTARAGGFLRYEWSWGETSASAGWSSDSLVSDGNLRANFAHSATPFATFSVLARF